MVLPLESHAQNGVLLPPSPPQWPLLVDADQDGLTDGDEILLWLNPLDAADGLSDLDGDGLSLAWEWQIDTAPDRADTDADGWSDSDELLVHGTDPRDATSRPADAAQVQTSSASPQPSVLMNVVSTTATATAPPSLMNGDFTNASAPRWYDATKSTSYQGSGFKWGEGTASGWTAYRGSSIEIWQTNGQSFVELDGNKGSYGIKQPIKDVRACSLLLAWKQSGRNNPLARNDAYYVQVYYQNTSGAIQVISKTPVYQGFSKTAWTDNAHVFTIKEQDIQAAAGAPIYVAFIPEDLNTYGTLIDAVNLLPVELISDLNNDGQISAADNPLREAAAASGATDEIKDKGTEFIFHNDTLSNGIWDKEDSDPAKPATAKDDDDAEEIRIKPGITEGEVWLDHPAIAGLSFYKTRECKAADKVNLSPTSKFTVSASNPFPDTLYMRADVDLTDPEANSQFEGDLVLKIKVGTAGQEIEAVKMKLTVVKQLGAKKYFHAVRDYIFENNTKTFTQEKAYGASTKYRIVGMREESTFMSGLDTYDHTADAPRLRGIDDVKANYTSDVIINGNQCFFHDDRNPYIAGLTSQMTNRCEGRLCVARNILRPPSDDTHNPNLGGPGARYVDYTGGDPQIINGQVTVPSEFNFATGQIPEAVPATPDHGIGGLAAKYDRQELQDFENQAIGRGPAIESGKGIIFTATTYVGNTGNAIEFAADARKSGVKPLSGGDGSQWELLFLDGSSSVGLVLTNPQDVQKTVIKGGKHTGAPYYYINTYLLFECQKARN